MIETGQELVDQYSAAFVALGGDPDSCEGVIWAREVVSRSESLSATEVITDIASKIVEGTANHGWLLGILGLLWDQLTEQQRLVAIRSLIAGGAHKGLLQSRTFPTPFTKTERQALEAAFEQSGCVAALRRLRDG